MKRAVVISWIIHILKIVSMQKIALITWIGWQDGAYMSHFLLSKGYRVIGLLRSSDSSRGNLEYFGIVDQIEYIYGDLSDEGFIWESIARYQPDEVYHLGWLTTPWKSWNDPKSYISANMGSTLAIIEAIHRSSRHTRLFCASSSSIYDAGSPSPHSIGTPIHPMNPYALTKASGYSLVEMYRRAYDIYLVNGVLFNHESPLRTRDFVTGKICEGVSRISLWLDTSITLGNLDVARDWSYAGDFVEGMWLSLQRDTPDNYIFSSGITHTLRELLDIAFSTVGISRWGAYIIQDPSLVRPTDLQGSYGDTEMTYAKLWWHTTTPFHEMIAQMVDYQLQKAKKTL
jgi:GDPmannose 4,6-dehydratase